MPDNQAVIQVLYQTQGVENIKVANTQLKQSETAAKKVGDAHTQALSMTRREWMRTGSEAAFYMTNVAGNVGEVGRALSGATAIATQLGESALFGGAVGIGLAATAVAVGYVANQLNAVKEAGDKAAEPFAKIRTDIDALVRLQGLDLAAQRLGLTKDALTAYLTTSKAGETNMRTYGILQQKIADNDAQIIAIKERLVGLMAIGEKNVIEENERAITALNAENDKYRAGLAVVEPLIKKESTAQAEHNRVLDEYKKNVPAARKATEDYGTAMNKLASDHKKAIAGFADDWSKADKDAADKRSDNETKTAKRIIEINEDAAKRIAEINKDLNKQLEDDKYEHALKLSDITDAYGKTEADANQKLLDNWKKLKTDLANLDRTTGENINAALTERDKAQIAQKAEIERKSLRDAAAEQRAQIARDRIERQSELTKQRNEENVRFERQMQQARDLAQEQRGQAAATAEENRRQARETAKEQGEAIAKVLKETQDAITKRKDAELNAYNENSDAQTKAYQKHKAELMDTRKEEEKLRDDLLFLENHGWKIPLEFVNAMLPASAYTYKYTGGWRGGHAQGGSGVFPGSGSEERMYYLSAQPGETWNITPKSGGSNGGGNTNNFYITSNDPDEVARKVVAILESERNR